MFELFYIPSQVSTICFFFFFCSPLTPEQRAENNAIVMFKLEDQDFMGMKNEYISEAFVHFKDIPSTQLENDLGSVPQIRLTLTSPKSLGRYIDYNAYISFKHFF